MYTRLCSEDVQALSITTDWQERGMTSTEWSINRDATSKQRRINNSIYPNGERLHFQGSLLRIQGFLGSNASKSYSTDYKRFNAAYLSHIKRILVYEIK